MGIATAKDWVSQRVFNWVHQNHLIYNTCWEDPRLDRTAMRLNSEDRLLMITSAGCNALDYALDAPAVIHAVDMNPKQNALLDLKIAGIKTLSFEEFFEIFGRGRYAGIKDIYSQKIRPALKLCSQPYWDEKIKLFGSQQPTRSFYFHGTSGYFARFINKYMKSKGIVEPIRSLFFAKSLEEQRRIYFEHIQDRLWNRFFRWTLSQDSVLSLLGVPRAQKDYLEKHFNGRIADFMEYCLRKVLTEIPIHDNYFWWLYFAGHYREDCSPNYLKREHFHALKGGLVERIETHTSDLSAFLETHPESFSKFIFLDHMDWLSTHRQSQLWHQWQMVMDRSREDAQYLWRSGAWQVDFVDPIQIQSSGRKKRLGDILDYDRELADELHRKDRVHTYGSFYIAKRAS